MGLSKALPVRRRCFTLWTTILKSTSSAKASLDAQQGDKQQQAVATVDSLEALGYEPDDALATETGAQSSKSSGRRWFTAWRKPKQLDEDPLDPLVPKVLAVQKASQDDKMTESIMILTSSYIDNTASYAINACSTCEMSSLNANKSFKTFDVHDAEKRNVLLRSRQRDDTEKNPRRSKLLATIQSKLNGYANICNDLLFRTKELLSLQKPTKRNRQSLANYLDGHQSLAMDDTRYIRYSDDLVALGGDYEDSRVNGWIEDIMKGISVSVSQYFFRSKVQRMKTDDEHIKYYAKERLDIVVRMFLTFAATLWLMAPVFVFYWVASKGLYKDMIVLVFTMGFRDVLSNIHQG